MVPDCFEEDLIFSQLENLCSQNGFIYAIAYFCLRDNIIITSEGPHFTELVQENSLDGLLRTEISTLISLTIKGNQEIIYPGNDTVIKFVNETEKLLHNLHQAVLEPSKRILDSTKSNPFMSGDVLRESIFYSCESAFNFQFKDFSCEKYVNDNEWFIANKGYSVQQAISILSALSRLQIKKIETLVEGLLDIDKLSLDLLEIYKFSIEELTIESKEDQTIVKAFIESFVLPIKENLTVFNSISDFNPIEAYPIIRIGERDFLLFQIYKLMQALYETPFFWFMEDTSYKDNALLHRGRFTEDFSRKRLLKVFGKNNVFKNVNLYKGKKNIGEIDVLVTFGNRAILVQAKSKKLTIESRKGNNKSLRNDFKKAIQDAYDQALSSAKLLIDDETTLIDSNGKKLDLPQEFKEIYLFCVISDHYPSLSFQVYNFLNYEVSKIIMPPFVIDLFYLDVLCEMLQSPLYFLSFINRRVQYKNRLLANHEIAILGYPLQNNLWLEDNTDLMIIEDDLSSDINLAMMARRSNSPGNKTPKGILTNYKNTPFRHLISQIEYLDSPEIIDLGLMLLKLSEDAVNTINEGIRYIVSLCSKDNYIHDFSIGIGGKAGLTIHCNKNTCIETQKDLGSHCLLRKYKEKANTWFGICINTNTQIQLAFRFDFLWEKNDEMEKLINL